MAITRDTTIDEIVDQYPDTWEVLDDWEITMTPAVGRSSIHDLCKARDLDMFDLLEDLRESAESYDDDWDDD